MDLFCNFSRTFCRLCNTPEGRSQHWNFFIFIKPSLINFSRSHSYSHSPGRLHRHTRTKAAILSMGEPIIGATITTLSVSFLMLFCKIVFFVKFAQLLIVTISFSLLGGLVFHSVLVDCFGPEDPLTTYKKLRGLLTFREPEINSSNSGDGNGKDRDSSSHSSARNATVYDLSESMDRKRKVHFQTSQKVSDKEAKDKMDTTSSQNRQSTYVYDLGGKGVEEMNIKWSKSPADITIRFENFTESYRNGQVVSLLHTLMMFLDYNPDIFICDK